MTIYDDFFKELDNIEIEKDETGNILYNKHSIFQEYKESLEFLYVKFKSDVIESLKQFTEFRLAYEYLMDLKYNFEEILYKHQDKEIITDVVRCSNEHKFLLRGTDIKKAEIFHKQQVITTVNANRFLSNKGKLIKEIRKITNRDYFKEAEKENNSEYYWQRSKIDLIELIISVIKSGAILKKEGEIQLNEAVSFFSNLLNLEINDMYVKISKSRNRKRQVSPFWYDLQHSYQQYLSETDKN